MKKRTHAFCLRLTEEEFKNLTGKAADAGISREEFCRRILNGAEVRARPPADVPQLIREVRRVGNNIDQILMIANAKGLLDVPQLRKAMADLRDVEKLISDTYSQVSVHRHKK